MVRRTRINPGDESGIALVMALGIMLVLTLVLTTVITFTAAGARDSQRVNAGQKATALAEAGLNSALAVLHKRHETSPYPQYPGHDRKVPPAAAGAPITYAGYDASVDATACGSLTPFVTAYDGGSCVAPVDKCVTWSGTLRARVRNRLGLAVGDPLERERAQPHRARRRERRPHRGGEGSGRQGRGLVSTKNPLNYIYGQNIRFNNSVGVSTPVYAKGT